MTKQIEADVDILESLSKVAHKGGYQVAVLAVKESSNGKQFSFNYEGVAGKPCKLLEQLFKELVTASGGICSQEYIVGENTNDSDLSRKSSHDLNKSECLKDGEKLELLLDIASLISTNRTQQQRPVSKMKKKRAKRNRPINACVVEGISNPLIIDSALIPNSELPVSERSADSSNVILADTSISASPSSSNLHDENAGGSINAPGLSLMEESAPDPDRPKTQGASYISESLPAIFPPDDYYSPMNERTTTESYIDPETANEFLADIVKAEPDYNMDVENEPSSRGNVRSPTATSSAEGPSTQDNCSKLLTISSYTGTKQSKNGYKQCQDGSPSEMKRVEVTGTRNRIKSFTCKYCSYTCYHSGIIKRHTDAVHLKLKPYQCPSCPYSTTRRYYLRNHMLQKH